jgi:hypothetical protein
MKKATIVSIILILTSLTLIFGLGNGGEKVRDGMVISIGSLNEISTSSSWELTIVEGNVGELIIDSANRNGWVDYRDGKLELGEKSRIGFQLAKNRATLKIPRLAASLHASSSSEILVDMSWEGDNLIVDTSSSGQISLKDITAQRVEVRTSSSGRIILDRVRTESITLRGSSSGRISLLEGQTDSLDSSFSSSSKLSAENFMIIDRLDVQGSSSSFQELSVRDSITARGSLSSSSRLILHGNPSARILQDIKTSSGGKLEIE